MIIKLNAQTRRNHYDPHSDNNCLHLLLNEAQAILLEPSYSSAVQPLVSYIAQPLTGTDDCNLTEF